MTLSALLVGGTGPTGPYLVRGLRERGYDVAILHRGTHEVDEIPPEVVHLHSDPYDAAALESALAGRRFDVVVATYGRLREVARVCVERTGQFVGVGGVPLYRGWMRPEDLAPRGLPVPVREDAPQIESEGELRKGATARETAMSAMCCMAWLAGSNGRRMSCPAPALQRSARSSPRAARTLPRRSARSGCRVSSIRWVDGALPTAKCGKGTA